MLSMYDVALNILSSDADDNNNWTTNLHNYSSFAISPLIPTQLNNPTASDEFKTEWNDDDAANWLLVWKMR